MNTTFNSTSTTLARVNVISNEEIYHKNIPVLAFVIIQLVILIISIIGNAIVILIVVKKRRMQTFTNWLILNLAVADVYSVLICIPLEIPIDFGQKWPYGGFFCRIYYPMQTSSIYGSVFTLVSLSLSRYWAVIHPFRRQPSVKTAKLLIPIIWMCSLAVVLPYIMVLQYHPETHECAEIWTDKERRRYTLAIFIFQYGLPLCIICVSYSYIAYDLKFRKTEHALPKDDRKRVEIQKVIKLLIVITATFALCILPYHVIALLMEFGVAIPHSADFITMSYLILYANAALNPIIYNVFNSKFREAFRELYLTIKTYLSNKNNESPTDFFSSRRPSMFPNFDKSKRGSTIETTMINADNSTIKVERDNFLTPHFQPSEYSYLVAKKARDKKIANDAVRLMGSRVNNGNSKMSGIPNI